MEFNAYADIYFADEYFRYRLGTLAWDNASENEKMSALQMAADSIDTLALKGEATNADQVRRFPRDGEFDVPTNVKKACVLIALEFLKGVDPEEEYELLTRENLQYGTIREQRNTNFMAPHKVAGIPSLQAFQLLTPYLRDEHGVKLERA